MHHKKKEKGGRSNSTQQGGYFCSLQKSAFPVGDSRQHKAMHVVLYQRSAALLCILTSKPRDHSNLSSFGARGMSGISTVTAPSRMQRGVGRPLHPPGEKRVGPAKEMSGVDTRCIRAARRLKRLHGKLKGQGTAIRTDLSARGQMLTGLQEATSSV